ncbi:MAG: TetR/AcrR family transcriptional regulator, partial [Pararhodobacter sp.]
TKGAFFHHFPSKEALGIAAAGFWAETTGALFASAPYHLPADPLDRIHAYLDFRRDLIAGEIWQWTCLVGTMAEEVHASHPAIAEACGASIFAHAETLEADIAAAMQARGITRPDAASLARHTQTVLQGAFVLAKAGGGQAVARESVDHLRRYLDLLFSERAT